jgi:hypothetical protein
MRREREWDVDIYALEKKMFYRILQFIQCSPLFYYRQYFNARELSRELVVF